MTAWDSHAGGAHSIVYSPRHQLLVTGGKRGDIVAYDVRQRQSVAHFPTAHALNVKTLAVHPSESFIASASTDGSIKVNTPHKIYLIELLTCVPSPKIWEIPSMQEKIHWPDIHEKKTFVKPPTGFFTRPVGEQKLYFPLFLLTKLL